MSYIFVAGAPGSKWSSVAKNIYFSPSIDKSDSNDQRQYDLTGHCGAYWDPGMEFDIPEDFSTLDPAQAQALWDAPFSGTGCRIVKSHVFCYRKNIDYLRRHWPNAPIVLVYRPDDACVGWWVRSGGFSITYPNYAPYYQDLATMCDRVTQQNRGLLSAWSDYEGTEPATNRDLARLLALEPPPLNHVQDYHSNDIKVKVI
jgi:hypothetical protein